MADSPEDPGLRPEQPGPMRREAESALPEPELRAIFRLAEGIGPRPPCSGQEREAAEAIASELRQIGATPLIERFRSRRSFGSAYLFVFALSLSGALLRGRFRRVGGVGAVVGAVLGMAESRFSAWSPLKLLNRRESRNVFAWIPQERDPTGRFTSEGSRDASPNPGPDPDAQPGETTHRTETVEPAEEGGAAVTGTDRQVVCLVSHMDSSRSGLMFHRVVTPYLGRLVTASGVAVAVNAFAPLLRRWGLGKATVFASRGLIALAGGLLLEREILGEDVPGANDNASGVAACLKVAGYFTVNPLENTELAVLVTGSEESGVIGMQSFLAGRDTTGWAFINFDGISADAPLRVLTREGGPGGPDADPELLAAARRVGEMDPNLRARPLKDGSGLPYDSTAVLMRGGRALTIANQEGAIPDYHWPTDTVERISPEAFVRAVRFAVRLVTELDARADGGKGEGR